MGRYKRRDPYHFGIDYFKAYVSRDKYRRSPVMGLSRNSDLFGYDKETHILYRPDFARGKYDKYFEVRDVPTGVNLAFLMLAKAGKTWSVETRDKFEVTWQGLMLRHVNFYRKLIDVLGYQIDGFQRVDIALDVPINTDYVCTKVLMPNLEGKTYKPWIRNGKVETLDIGEREQKKNTWKFVRVYDKVEDTRVKWKEFLYQFKDRGITEMTRFELELRRDKCKHFHESYLDDPEMLYKIFKYEVFGTNWQFFKFIHEEDAKKVLGSYLVEPFSDHGIFNLTAGESKRRAMELQERKTLYGSEFKTEDDRARAVAIMVAYAKRLVGDGYTIEGLTEILRANIPSPTPEKA